MKNIWLNHEYPQAAKLARQFPDPSHSDRTLNVDTRVIARDGDVIAVLLCDVIPAELHELAYKLFKPVKERPSDRAMALGTRPLPRSIGLHGKPSPRIGVNQRVLDASKAYSGRLGWKEPGSKTKLTLNHPEMLNGNKRLVRFVAKLYRQYLPALYARQQEVLDRVPRYRLSKTAFSTIYIAKNFRTAYHRDKGNLSGVMTCLIPTGKFEGGALVLPRFRIAFALRPGDVLFFNPKELHGNLLFKGKRISLALYCGGWVAKCSAG